MEFCKSVMEYYQSPPPPLNLTKFVPFFPTKKCSISIESPHFLTFWATSHECKICVERLSWKNEKRSWKSQGRFMVKRLVSSVGTLTL